MQFCTISQYYKKKLDAKLFLTNSYSFQSWKKSRISFLCNYWSLRTGQQTTSHAGMLKNPILLFCGGLKHWQKTSFTFISSELGFQNSLKLELILQNNGKNSLEIYIDYTKWHHLINQNKAHYNLLWTILLRSTNEMYVY